MSTLKVQEHPGKVTFTAKIVPGSSKTAVVGLLDGMLKVKVAAAPEKGKANAALAAFLAKQLGIRKNAVTIVSGQTSPVKQIEVAGITASALLAALGIEPAEDQE